MSSYIQHLKKFHLDITALIVCVSVVTNTSMSNFHKYIIDPNYRMNLSIISDCAYSCTNKLQKVFIFILCTELYSCWCSKVTRWCGNLSLDSLPPWWDSLSYFESEKVYKTALVTLIFIYHYIFLSDIHFWQKKKRVSIQLLQHWLKQCNIFYTQSIMGFEDRLMIA